MVVSSSFFAEASLTVSDIYKTTVFEILPGRSKRK